MEKPSRTWTIFCTWALSAPPQPATEFFTWFGVYCTTWQPNAAASARAETAGLTDAHRRAHVDLEEDLLDSDDIGTELAQQGDDLGLQRGQALRQLIGGRRAQDTERNGLRRARAGAVEDGIAAPGEAGVDPEDTLRNEHRFVL